MALLLAFALQGAAAGVAAQQPRIDRITPEVLRPGGRATLEGRNLSPSGGSPRVTVDGVAARVVSASRTRVVVELPRSGFRCLAREEVSVAVTARAATDSLSHPLSTGTPVSLAVGEARVFTGPAPPCLELTRDGGYLLPVVNGNPDPGQGVSSRVWVSAGASVPVPPSPPAPERSPLAGAAATIAPSRRDLLGPPADTLQRDLLAHAEALERNRETVELMSLQSEAPLGLERELPAPLSGHAAIRPGDLVPMRFATTDGCGVDTLFQARAVYVGRYTVVLEDTAAPLHGTMDSYFQSLGTEYDNVVHPMLLAYFGNPLAFDRYLDRDGRLFMLFTPVMNEREPRLAGLVNACDFYPRTQKSASNEAEVFYAPVPADTAAIAHWMRVTRSTVPHEVNHVVAFASRFAGRAADFEESWLLEALAMQAEEIYARGFSGARWAGNAAYEETRLWCDEWPADARCVDRPYGMMDHFRKLNTYLASSATLSPLRDFRYFGLPPTLADISFYGSAWSLLRWTTDHYSGGDERAFFRAVTQEVNAIGTDNLYARTRRPFEELLVNWGIAMATDDAPGYTPGVPLQSFPSWNLADVYGGLHQDLAGEFPDEFPMKPVPVGEAAFDQSIGIGGGTMAFFELQVAGGRPRAVEVSEDGSGAMPRTMRVAVVRTK